MASELTIAAVHATPASIPPLRAALKQRLPGATMWNIVDDGLAPAADAVRGVLTPSLRDRMLNLVRHGVDGGADAVVIACSMYGEVADIAEKIFATPVFSSDADMLAAVVDEQPERVAVLASLRGAATDTSGRLAAVLAKAGLSAEVVPVFCEGAAEAAHAGDVTVLATALANGLRAADGSFDLVCIAQYSLSPAADELAARIAIPVSAPTTAAAGAVADHLGQP